VKTLLALLLLATPASAQTEARSLAVSGHTLYVGTSRGTIYSSVDDGHTWQGFTKFRSDYVIDRIAIDGDRLYVAAWTMGDSSQGAFFVSGDAGKHWKLTSGRHFTALVLADERYQHRGAPVESAPRDRKVVFVGDAGGVYSSMDGGETFEPISTGIRDVQSIAVDPSNIDDIYVGTWHLGYFTRNGGKTWHSIHKGVIDDSDFFSIVLSPDGAIYIGACSGIYKGSDDGEQFRKEKTKTDARRTKVLRQIDDRTLYAGTTDGIWLTVDGGKTWKRRGSRYIVVNDMVLTSPNHLVVATLQHGVIWSDDGGKHYTEAQF
jgi:photosystem II stability/assembly factor-like uncharacterized protein